MCLCDENDIQKQMIITLHIWIKIVIPFVNIMNIVVDMYILVREQL